MAVVGFDELSLAQTMQPPLTTEGKRKTSLWASHPSLDDRISALQNLGLAG